MSVGTLYGPTTTDTASSTRLMIRSNLRGGRDRRGTPTGPRPPRSRSVVLEVAVDKAEALAIAHRPLEVVDERPRVVAAYVNALVDGARDLADVTVVKIYASLIVHASVRAGTVAVRATILCDVDRRPRIILRDVHDLAIDRCRPDLRVEVGVRGRSRDLPRSEIPRVVRVRDDGARVQVDADEVERRFQLLHVAGPDGHARERPLLIDVCVRVLTLHDRPQEPVVREAMLPLRRRAVVLAVGRRVRRARAERRPDRIRSPRGAHRLRRRGVREAHDVR